MATDGETQLIVPVPPSKRRWTDNINSKLLAAGLLFGIVGGMIGTMAMVRFFPGAIPTDKKQLIIQESSAVIDVAKQVSPAVVSITSQAVTRDFFGNAQQAVGAGTGMIVTSDGLILTNRHVVDDTTANYTVITTDGKTYPAKVVSKDTVNDVAFVRITATGLPVVKLGDSGSVQVGQRVVAIGNALGQYQNSVTDGIISGLSRGVVAGDGSATGTSSEVLQNLLQTDAAINPGNSGGPLVNLDGQVVGINTAVAGQAQNIGFAIPINEAKPLIASVESVGKIVRPYLGVRYVAIDQQVATQNSLAVSSGAWVQAGTDQSPAVVAGSPAAKAGIKEGDIITKVGGDTVDSTHSLQSLISNHKVGDTVSVTVLRDGKTLTLSTKLEAAPAS
jgi:serine protease Do